MRVVKTSIVSGSAFGVRHSSQSLSRLHRHLLERRAPSARRRRKREAHARAFRPSDPVPLHRQHFFGPARQPVGGLEQLVGVVRDAEEPLLQLAYRDRRAAPPAAAIDDLLVGEDGVAARAPVDVRALAEREIALEHLQEQPLVPVVVVRQAGRDLALPGVADPDALKLTLHVGDVLERPRLRVHATFDCRVLGGQPERVPSERVQHIEPAHPFHARDDVADHVVADVSDVRVPRWVGKHLQAVELRPGVVLGDLEGTLAPPALLPLLFDCLGFVVGHDLSIIFDADGPKCRRPADSVPQDSVNTAVAESATFDLVQQRNR